MKIKLQNLLKHNWRTLLLLCTLITTSQGAWGTFSIPANTTIYVDVSNFNGDYNNGNNYYVNVITDPSNGADNVLKNINQANTSGCPSFVPRNDRAYYKGEKVRGRIYSFKITQAAATAYGILVMSKEEKDNNDLWEVNASGNTTAFSEGQVYVIQSGYTTHGDRRTSCFTGTWKSSVCEALTPPDGILGGTKIMYYIYQSYGGTIRLSNGNKNGCYNGTDTKYSDTPDGSRKVVTQSTSILPLSNVYITNNCSDWGGDGTFTINSETAGKQLKDNNGTLSTDNATFLSTFSASSTSIAQGTENITLTLNGGTAKSSGGEDLWAIIYVGDTKKDCIELTSSDKNYTLTTSGLSEGTYPIKAVLTDGSIYYVNNESITLTVNTTCTPPTPEFNASADQSNLYFSNGDNVSTTLSTAANSNWDFQWVCTQMPTYGATTYNPKITSATSNSTTVTFPIEGVYKFKVKAKCKSGNESAWVESTEVTVTVHLVLNIKGPITCSACDFSTNPCNTYTQVCDLTTTNTVTYNFTGYYKSSATYKGEFCLNANSSTSDDTHHIHSSTTYTGNNLTLTGIAYNTTDGHNYNLMSSGLTIAETGTLLSLTITHTGGKNYTLSLALLNCPDISIKTHPSSDTQTLCKNGSPTNLTVEGQGGTTPYTYQWYQNTENATSGATMVSGATSATITPATTATGTLYYYCVVSSAGLCSGKKATSNVSGGVTVATPKLTASATSVTNFTPVVITSDVVLNNTKFTITDVQSTDSYLYENTTESVIFKGDVGGGSSKTFTISGTARDVSCTGTVDITVSKDANSCD